MSFDVAGKRLATINFAGIQGVKCAGFYKLQTRIAVNVTPWPDLKRGELVLFDLFGRLTIEGGHHLAELGTLHPAHPPVHIEPEGTNMSSGDLWLEVELDRARLEAIEEHRASGDLVFNIDITGRVLHRGSLVIGGENHLRYEMPQGAWVKLLNQMQYTHTLLFEVPASEAAGEAAAGVPLLEQAQQAFLARDWRGAVGKCREVLEAIERVRGADEKEELPKARERNKRQRIRALRAALKDLTQPAHHQDEVAIGHEYTREDARAIIIMAAALLAIA